MRAVLPRALLALVVLVVAAPASLAAPQPAQLESFVTLLHGDAVVPPVASRGAGVVSFLHVAGQPEISTSLGALVVGSITGAHLHLGEVGENGPVVADVAVGQGRLTAADLRGPLAGADLDALLELMRSGGVYVDVHTLRFPDGELRGQVFGRRGTG